MKKTTLEPVDGSRSRLTGETGVEVEASPRSTKPVKKKGESLDDGVKAAIEAFNAPIANDIDKPAATVNENLRELIEKIEKVRDNYNYWHNTLSHVQRTMLIGALYAAKEALGETDNGVPISFQRFLGITFR